VRAAVFLVAAAAVILMITAGIRLTSGLFLSPINTATGLGIATVSFAMAISQFVWGLAQPVFGAVADRWGPGRVIVMGGLMLAAGTALTPFLDSQLGLIFALGILSAAGAGAGSFSVLMGAAAQRVPPEQRALASGVINAGASVGQLVYAPIVQATIAAFGWVTSMLWVAASALITLPLAWPLRRRAAEAGQAAPTQGQAARPEGPTASPQGQGTAAPESGFRAQLRIAFADRSYLFLHAGFFTCGFHIAFLITHMPGEVELCGLPAQVSANAIALIGLFNILGSIGTGMLCARYSMKNLLAAMYASRAVVILIYLAAPKTTLTMYAFAAVLGLTWLATVPPTAGLVGKLFGTRYLATLFGLTLLSHQTGAFFGAWLGGLAFAASGDFQWMWYADIVLALAAALISLPIREGRDRTLQPRAA
jgi:MFS family permease